MNSDSDSGYESDAIEASKPEIEFVKTIQFSESQTGFISQHLLTQDMIRRIKKTKLKLSKDEVFKGVPSSVTQAIYNCTKRKNEINYFISSQEMHVELKDAQGSAMLPLITRDEISKNMGQIHEKVRPTISNLHLGAIQIAIKADFAERVNTPMTVAIFDKRFSEEFAEEGLLGAAQANLYASKFIFTVYPRFAISLEDGNLDKVLSFVYNFERANLLKEKSRVFSVTYLVAYALTNSHHSIDYRSSKYVSLEDIFTKVGKVEEKKFIPIKPPKEKWMLEVGESSKTRPRKPSKLRRQLTKRDLGEVSRRIDILSQKLVELSGTENSDD